MPPPNDSPLPTGVQVLRIENGAVVASDPLSDLLVVARTNYDWPAGTGAARSQGAVLRLEEEVARALESRDAEGAHAIVSKVSRWGGNNTQAQAAIDSAPPQTRADMMASIKQVIDHSTLDDGLDSLSNLTGLRLVMATKVYRFCCPSMGAAVDRHTSYFFNSLDITNPESSRRKTTMFHREWSNGTHTQSRLAIYHPSRHAKNRDEFISWYLPLLAQIADSLNGLGTTFKCAATGTEKSWRPADVEMAAYYWWAHHGPM